MVFRSVSETPIQVYFSGNFTGVFFCDTNTSLLLKLHCYGSISVIWMCVYFWGVTKLQQLLSCRTAKQKLRTFSYFETHILSDSTARMWMWDQLDPTRKYETVGTSLWTCIKINFSESTSLTFCYFNISQSTKLCNKYPIRSTCEKIPLYEQHLSVRNFRPLVPLFSQVQIFVWRFFT